MPRDALQDSLDSKSKWDRGTEAEWKIFSMNILRDCREATCEDILTGKCPPKFEELRPKFGYYYSPHKDAQSVASAQLFNKPFTIDNTNVSKVNLSGRKGKAPVKVKSDDFDSEPEIVHQPPTNIP